MMACTSPALLGPGNHETLAGRRPARPAVRTPGPALRDTRLALGVILWLGSAGALAAPMAVSTQPAEGSPTPWGATPPLTGDDRPEVTITSNRFELRPGARQAVWEGRVVARRGPTLLRCKRLVADYTEAREISRIVCTGGVEVEEGDLWAKGERAVFRNLEDRIEVEGNPEARVGPNRMRGSRVVLQLDRHLLTVEDATTVFKEAELERRAKPSRGDGTR